MEENEVVEGTQEVSTEAGGEQVPVIKDPKAVLEALERAKNDAKKYREELEAKERAVTELAERLTALEGDEGIAKWKKKAVALSAKQELLKAGVKDTDRIYGLMDSETLDLDDDGNLVGFAEALQTVKARLPELFDDKKRVGGSVDAFASEPVKQKMSGTEAQVKRIFQKS